MERETRMWFHALPAQIKQACRIDDRILGTRYSSSWAVHASCSPVAGGRNAELDVRAMATGAFPILSPLDTIRPLVRDGSNVLFARNLYPDEIGEALVRQCTTTSS
jgi:hypothetical protein